MSNPFICIIVYGRDEMNTQIESLSDDEDSMYATDQEYNSSASESSQGCYCKIRLGSVFV